MNSIIGLVAVAILCVASALAQDISPKLVTGNPAKRPPALKPIFVPDLRLRGSESVEVNATVPKTYNKTIFTFLNWDAFPAAILKPTSKPPSLPPSPCKQLKTSARLFAVLRAKNGEAIGCTELKPGEDFSFLFGPDEQLPAFVYVTVVDRTKPGALQSSLVSPSSGLTK